MPAHTATSRAAHGHDDLAWIHIQDVSLFLYLGANPHEVRVGQNIRMDLSVRIPYRGTGDRLERTVDYGILVERIQSFIEGIGKVRLLEYLAEQLLDLIEHEFPEIGAARLTLRKAFVPITHFTGSVAIEVAREFPPRRPAARGRSRRKSSTARPRGS